MKDEFIYGEEKNSLASNSELFCQKFERLWNRSNPPLVAMFTYHEPTGEKAGRSDYQYQGIAYSLNEGRTWAKYDKNPVIPNTEKLKDFRDPKVFWHEGTKRWLVVLAAGDRVRFYSSRDLKNWQVESEFGKSDGSHGGVWECPDLFPLKVKGTNQEKWVLLVSINPGGVHGVLQRSILSAILTARPFARRTRRRPPSGLITAATITPA